MALSTNAAPFLLQVGTIPKSRLLGLPAEIRNHIYEYTLTVEDCPAESKDSTSEFNFDGRIYTSVLLVCRQTYDEARCLPFRLNTFTFPVAHGLEVFVQKTASWQQDEVRNINLRLCGLCWVRRKRLVCQGLRRRLVNSEEVISTTNVSLKNLAIPLRHLEKVQNLTLDLVDVKPSAAIFPDLETEVRRQLQFW